MGLGKSLTTIAFLHTMLEAKIFRKCCVVCPASLTNNWKREIQKWLASDGGGKTQKLHPTCIVGNSHSKNLLKNQTGKDKMKFVIKAFLHGKTISDKLLILSYEQLRNHADELAAGIDFLVLDEGHRIGGGGSQTAAVLRKFSEGRNVAGSGYSSSLSGAGGANNKGSASSAMGQQRSLLRGVARKCHDSSYPMRPKSMAMGGFPTKKLLLSGTPLQNNLDEFFALVDFLNPGCVGASEESFNQVFKKPILAGRAKQADDCARKLGAARFAYLNALTGPFLLRRTAGDVLKHLLPPMQTLVVWCGLGDEWTKKCSNNSALQLMLDLRKICYESKMHFLKALLQTMARKKQKCVLVSNFTRCLDLVEGILCELALQSKGGLASFSYERLDGSTEQKARQPMVDRFNKPVAARTCAPSCPTPSPGNSAARWYSSSTRAPEQGQTETASPENEDDTSEAHQLNPPVNFFLLSSKAGGVGLNLVGGSRLVMLDPDWNPANDAQAMRRVWRDGQKNEVFVYRLVVPGSIEECILCRQEKKEDLLHGVLSNGNGGSGGMKRKAGVTGLSLAEAKQVLPAKFKLPVIMGAAGCCVITVYAFARFFAKRGGKKASGKHRKGGKKKNLEQPGGDAVEVEKVREGHSAADSGTRSSFWYRLWLNFVDIYEQGWLKKDKKLEEMRMQEAQAYPDSYFEKKPRKRNSDTTKSGYWAQKKAKKKSGSATEEDQVVDSTTPETRPDHCEEGRQAQEQEAGSRRVSVAEPASSTTVETTGGLLVDDSFAPPKAGQDGPGAGLSAPGTGGGGKKKRKRGGAKKAATGGENANEDAVELPRGAEPSVAPRKMTAEVDATAATPGVQVADAEQNHAGQLPKTSSQQSAKSADFQPAKSAQKKRKKKKGGAANAGTPEPEQETGRPGAPVAGPVTGRAHPLGGTMVNMNKSPATPTLVSPAPTPASTPGPTPAATPKGYCGGYH
eukprot:g612.t1